VKRHRLRWRFWLLQVGVQGDVWRAKHRHGVEVHERNADTG